MLLQDICSNAIELLHVSLVPAASSQTNNS